MKNNKGAARRYINLEESPDLPTQHVTTIPKPILSESIQPSNLSTGKHWTAEVKYRSLSKSTQSDRFLRQSLNTSFKVKRGSTFAGEMDKLRASNSDLSREISTKKIEREEVAEEVQKLKMLVATNEKSREIVQYSFNMQNSNYLLNQERELATLKESLKKQASAIKAKENECEQLGKQLNLVIGVKSRYEELLKTALQHPKVKEYVESLVLDHPTAASNIAALFN
eukprot:TRINITY_DN36026_c0_g1_i1.p1 TRINITY_DN36026_c0_g1~~TRINITY_DN36026_c0_g1_i1.p1  ORF type:complete len:226 (+),score=27.72 TRINITY_DN36026_c0_g1_i1:837-1514(+)